MNGEEGMVAIVGIGIALGVFWYVVLRASQ